MKNEYISYENMKKKKYVWIFNFNTLLFDTRSKLRQEIDRKIL